MLDVKPTHRQFVAGAVLFCAVLAPMIPASAGPPRESGAASEPDWGPPPVSPIVTCEAVSIDPPPELIVIFHLVVDGVRIDRRGVKVSDSFHLHTADISDLTAGRGPIQVQAWATWNIGTGDSGMTDIVLECGQQPGARPTAEGDLVPAGPPSARVPGAPPGPALPVEALPDFVG